MNVNVNYCRVKAFPFHEKVQEFIDKHEVVYVVEQNRDAQLRGFDPQRGVLGNQNGVGSRVGDLEACREDAVIGSSRVEHIREPRRPDTVQLDAERSSSRKIDRRTQASHFGSPMVLQQPDGSAGVGADFVHLRLLAVQFLDHDQGENDVVLFESEQRCWISQDHTGVEYVGTPGGSFRHPNKACRLPPAIQGSFRPGCA